jgi:acetyl-CoA C-acetyltransferase
VLVPTDLDHHFTDRPIRILSSSVATHRFRIADSKNCLSLQSVQSSAEAAFRQANLRREDINLFELHDAFSIIACLSLEASGFAKAGQGWKLAAEGEIAIHGRIPITTMGGLKARGHPIGATALYQTCEIVLQLSSSAGENQVPGAKVALMQSIGGVASTVITHIFSN